MEATSDVAAIETTLLSWKAMVARAAEQRLEIAPKDPASLEPTPRLVREHAVHLAGLATVHVIKEVIHKSTRQSDKEKCTARLKHAELWAGYPRSLFYLCMDEETPLPKILQN